MDADCPSGHVLQAEAGQGLVEYTLILAFIALAVVLTLSLVGAQLDAFFSNVVVFLQGL